MKRPKPGTLQGFISLEDQNHVFYQVSWLWGGQNHVFYKASSPWEHINHVFYKVICLWEGQNHVFYKALSPWKHHQNHVLYNVFWPWGQIYGSDSGSGLYSALLCSLASISFSSELGRLVLQSCSGVRSKLITDEIQRRSVWIEEVHCRKSNKGKGLEGDWRGKGGGGGGRKSLTLGLFWPMRRPKPCILQGFASIEAPKPYILQCLLVMMRPIPWF